VQIKSYLCTKFVFLFNPIMKKIISFFAFVAIVLTFAACGGNTPELKDFFVQVNTLTAIDASFTITPLDQEANYFWYIYPKYKYEMALDQGKCSSEEEYVEDILAEWAQLDAGSWDILGQKGIFTISEGDVRNIITGNYFKELAPNYEHCLAICKIDADKNRDGEIFFYPFKTLIPEGYVDLGLPSERLWTTKYIFKNGQPAYYTFNEAYNLFDNIAYYERFPTKEIWGELWDYCTWTWGTNDGMNGYWVVSKTNGNKIFLPAAGYKDKNGVTKDVGYTGVYWTKDIGDNNNSHYAAIFTNGSFNRLSYADQNSFLVCLYCPDGETCYNYK